jgi:hypothetical protein
MRGSLCLADDLLLSQEGLDSMDLVSSSKVGSTHSQPQH